MIRLPDVQLPPTTNQQLKDWQQEIDQEPDYIRQVEIAKKQFKSRNKPANPVFKVVREKLTEMCQGAKRCGYCEDAPADEVEHIQPKNVFPEQCFVWGNYLYACGPCNSPKSDRYAVFDSNSGQLMHIPDNWSQYNQQSPRGQHALIHPRLEDPMHFLMLDILNESFFFAMLPDETDRIDYEKAKYTCALLRLNDRDYLVEARKNAYYAFKSMLESYIAKRDVQPKEAQLLVESIKRHNHQTVWAEMKRQKHMLKDIQQLFNQAPEALSW